MNKKRSKLMQLNHL